MGVRPPGRVAVPGGLISQLPSPLPPMTEKAVGSSATHQAAWAPGFPIGAFLHAPPSQKSSAEAQDVHQATP